MGCVVIGVRGVRVMYPAAKRRLQRRALAFLGAATAAVIVVAILDGVGRFFLNR
jgi:hypothetical protein